MHSYSFDRRSTESQASVITDDVHVCAWLHDPFQRQRPALASPLPSPESLYSTVLFFGLGLTSELCLTGAVADGQETARLQERVALGPTEIQIADPLP